jgi:MFS transporter, OPA family, sugar phosphate sensor protein UhpC
MAARALPLRVPSPLAARPAARGRRLVGAASASSREHHRRPSSAAAAAMLTVDEEEEQGQQGGSATTTALKQQTQPATATTMTPEERRASLLQLDKANQPPPHELSPTYSAEFVRRRWWAFAGIVVGYTAFYVTRSSLTYAAPLMVADPTSGVTLSTVGALTSVFPVAYGASKFASGVLGSKVSARLMLSVGLGLTACVNFMFGVGGPVGWLCALWALNGVLQGCGAPTCASILTRWYAAKERGTYWGAWSMSHNLGGFLAPVVVGSAATALGWRWGMWAPAVIGAVVAAFILVAVRDSPEQCGFKGPDNAGGAGSVQQQQQQQVERMEQQRPVVLRRQRQESEVAADKAALMQAIARSAAEKGRNPAQVAAARLLASTQRVFAGLTQGPVGAVLRNPLVWALAFTYFFVYVVRQGVTSWLMFYLMAEKGVGDATTAALTVSGLELGGLCGGAAAGLISDQAIKRAGPNAGHVGRRVRVCMAYAAGMALALLALKAVPSGQPALLAASVAALGFCIYGPQMLVGLAGAELVSPAGVGASQGLLGWIAYLGAANAGVPIAAVVQRSGWGGFFTAMLGATALVMLLLSSASNARSYAQRVADQEGQVKAA